MASVRDLTEFVLTGDREKSKQKRRWPHAVSDPVQCLYWPTFGGEDYVVVGYMDGGLCFFHLRTRAEHYLSVKVGVSKLELLVQQKAAPPRRRTPQAQTQTQTRTQAHRESPASAPLTRGSLEEEEVETKHSSHNGVGVWVRHPQIGKRESSHEPDPDERAGSSGGGAVSDEEFVDVEAELGEPAEVEEEYKLLLVHGLDGSVFTLLLEERTRCPLGAPTGSPSAPPTAADGFVSAQPPLPSPSPPPTHSHSGFNHSHSGFNSGSALHCSPAGDFVCETFIQAQKHDPKGKRFKLTPVARFDSGNLCFCCL